MILGKVIYDTLPSILIYLFIFYDSVEKRLP